MAGSDMAHTYRGTLTVEVTVSVWEPVPLPTLPVKTTRIMADVVLTRLKLKLETVVSLGVSPWAVLVPCVTETMPPARLIVVGFKVDVVIDSTKVELLAPTVGVVIPFADWI